MELVYEEDMQGLSVQDAYHIGQQLNSAIISPAIGALIEQMPIVLESSNNQNVESASSASASFLQNDNPISEHTIIFIPSNKHLNSV